jgi:hypothetical protein
MADNYMQFSETYGPLTEKQLKWIDLATTEAKVDDECKILPPPGQHATAEYWDEYDDARPALHFFAQAAIDQERGNEAAAEIDLNYVEDLDFSYTIEEAPETKKKHLRIYSEENCDLTHVAYFMYRLLQEGDDPNAVWSLTYAASCNKPRIGEFGGGAVVVTPEWVKWHNAHFEADRIKKEWRKEKGIDDDKQG